MKFKSQRGYTLIELLIVITIIGILASIMGPRYNFLMQKSYQAKAKSTLGFLRSALTMYYADTEGEWPLMSDAPGYPTTSPLSDVLQPKYVGFIPVPYLNDFAPDYNGLGFGYDNATANHWTSNPRIDVFIINNLGPGQNLGVDSPLAYDNESGLIYVNNDNYDTIGNPFYEW